MTEKKVYLIQDDVNHDGRADITIRGPTGPMMTLYNWKQMLGYFCGLTVSLVVAGLSAGALIL